MEYYVLLLKTVSNIRINFMWLSQSFVFRDWHVRCWQDLRSCFDCGQIERFIPFALHGVGRSTSVVSGSTASTGCIRRYCIIATGGRCRLRHHFLANFANFQLQTRFGGEYVLMQCLFTKTSNESPFLIKLRNQFLPGKDSLLALTGRNHALGRAELPIAVSDPRFSATKKSFSLHSLYP